MNKDDVKRLFDKLEDVSDEVQEIRESQVRTENDIKYHIKRTNLLEDLHKDNQNRIVALEEPGKARTYLVSAVLKLGAVAGAIYAVLRLSGKI